MLKIAPLAVRGALTLLLSPVILALPLQHPNVLVQGTVLDAGTGAAILDGTARATRGDEGLAWQAPIRDGHFTLELPAGEGYLLTVWAAGFHHHEFSRHFSPMGPEKAALFGIKRFE